MKRLFIILAAALSLVSCRKWVLEDRTACPSFLFFDITNADSFGPYDKVYTNVYAHPRGQFIDEAESTVNGINDKDLYFTVRSTEYVKGYGLMGYEALMRDGETYTLPLGENYPALFRYTYEDVVKEESFVVPVEFVKDYAKVTVEFVGYQTFTVTGGKFPFDVVVKGNTNGINAMTGIPVRGAYEVRPEEQTEGLYEFNLPRQADSQLIMEIYGRPAFPELEGHERTFNLYDILYEQGGVTWREKNLPDIRIVIDYQETTVAVFVTPWDKSNLHYEY